MVVLHTSLNVLWGTWEIAALPPQKEVFDVAGSLEEAHRARLKQKTKTRKHTACKQNWMWAKINLGAAGIFVYYFSAEIMVPGLIEKDLNTPSAQKGVDAKLKFAVSDSAGENPTDGAEHVSIGNKHTWHMRGWKA